MSDFSMIDICDAIATDLAPLAKTASRTAGSDGSYLDWRYAPPDMLTPENSPWLAVYSDHTTHTLLDTIGGYQDDETIEIQFGVSIAQSAELGGALTATIVKPVVEALEAIVWQLKGYADGLPDPFDNQVVGTLQATDRSTSTSLLWVQTTTLIVTSLGAE